MCCHISCPSNMGFARLDPGLWEMANCNWPRGVPHKLNICSLFQTWCLLDESWCHYIYIWANFIVAMVKLPLPNDNARLRCLRCTVKLNSQCFPGIIRTGFFSHAFLLYFCEMVSRYLFKVEYRKTLWISLYSTT